jgi:PAS domain S-box-containing protein
LELISVKSNLTIPLFSTQGIRHLLVMHSVYNERDWPEEVVQRLGLLGNVFVNALQRRDMEYALRESESRLNLAAESAGAGLWTLDVATGHFWLTDKTRQLLSFPRDSEITFDRFLDVVHPDDREKIHQTVRLSLLSKEETVVHYRIICPDGSVRWMASRGRLDADSSEAVSRLMGVTVDITDQKHLEEKIKNIAEQWQVTFDTIQHAILVLDCEFTIIRANAAAESILGRSHEEIVGRSCYKLVYGATMPFESCPVKKAFDSRRHEECEIYLDRQGLWLQVSADPIIDERGQLTGFINVLKDITERKQDELKLQNSREALRSFASRLLTIQEEERRRLARELHDDFTQRLAVLAMALAKLETTSASAVGVLKPKLVDIKEQIIKLSTDIHDISRQLHPSIIDDLGLARAIQSECANFTRRTGIRIHFEPVDSGRTIHRDVSVVLFRITQEALRNIQKHAHVNEADVSLCVGEDHITLTVHDSGAGFDPAHVRQTHGLGLFSMEERVQLVRGVFSVNSSPGRGTDIKVVIPFKRIERG